MSIHKRPKQTRRDLEIMWRRHKFRRENPERSGLIQYIKTQSPDPMTLTHEQMRVLMDDLFAQPPSSTDKSVYMSLHTQAHVQEVLERLEEQARRDYAVERLHTVMAGQRRRQKRHQNRRNN